MSYLPVNEFDSHAESVSHVGEGETAIGLEQLGVGVDAHLANVETIVRCQVHVVLHRRLYGRCNTMIIFDSPIAQNMITNFALEYDY